MFRYKYGRLAGLHPQPHGGAKVSSVVNQPRNWLYYESL